mmetsp:Transcript_1765/g.2157  ORF Transcript_1765/g.2157 Transcript_1765/m.2157 type:complete len:80 (+) Transcript_1765:13-252(+)
MPFKISFIEISKRFQAYKDEKSLQRPIEDYFLSKKEKKHESRDVRNVENDSIDTTYFCIYEAGSKVKSQSQPMFNKLEM